MIARDAVLQRRRLRRIEALASQLLLQVAEGHAGSVQPLKVAEMIAGKVHGRMIASVRMLATTPAPRVTVITRTANVAIDQRGGR